MYRYEYPSVHIRIHLYRGQKKGGGRSLGQKEVKPFSLRFVDARRITTHMRCVASSPNNALPLSTSCRPVAEKIYSAEITKITNPVWFLSPFSTNLSAAGMFLWTGRRHPRLRHIVGRRRILHFVWIFSFLQFLTLRWLNALSVGNHTIGDLVR